MRSLFSRNTRRTWHAFVHRYTEYVLFYYYYVYKQRDIYVYERVRTPIVTRYAKTSAVSKFCWLSEEVMFDLYITICIEGIVDSGKLKNPFFCVHKAKIDKYIWSGSKVRFFLSKFSSTKNKFLTKLLRNEKRILNKSKTNKTYRCTLQVCRQMWTHLLSKDWIRKTFFGSWEGRICWKLR